jgi:molybdopterin converting factor small subunit
MEIEIHAFGVVREIFQKDIVCADLPEQSTLLNIKSWIEEKYPGVKRLGSYMIAVNKEYVRDDQQKIFAIDEIAIIPPVSGG